VLFSPYTCPSPLLKGAASFTIYSNTKEYFRKHNYLTRNSIFDVAASGAVGGALAGAVITWGSVRELSSAS
jgi:hypothetical protein